MLGPQVDVVPMYLLQSHQKLEILIWKREHDSKREMICNYILKWNKTVPILHIFTPL